MWIRRAPYRLRVRAKTGAQDQGNLSEYGELSPGGVTQEHGILGVAAVITCFHKATHSLFRQNLLSVLLQSPPGCRANLVRFGC